MIENFLLQGFQESHATRFNRYPEIFKYAAILHNGGKILSYGCSDGAEVFSLASLYFDNSIIIGIDIVESKIKEALLIKQKLVNKDILKSNYVDFSLPNNAVCLLNAPYDCIFAVSVLCHYPHTKNQMDISKIFPFNQFVKGVTILDALFKIGGSLVLHNTNYSFEDTEFFKKYRKISIDPPLDPGFVPWFTPEGVPDETAKSYYGVMYTKVK